MDLSALKSELGAAAPDLSADPRREIASQVAGHLELAPQGHSIRGWIQAGALEPEMFSALETKWKR